MIAMTEVQSTALQAWGYDAASRVFAVRFKPMRVSHWVDVPQSVADDFAAAESKGRALMMLKGYTHTPVLLDEPPKAETSELATTDGAAIDLRAPWPFPHFPPVTKQAA